ncbi:cell wall hydrolase [Butyrivibrio sp.]|uniref:cell wall hydrolase n=1 Tax=Butyrivibrio sp. TaxID=28121 RepID=UPI0025EA8CBB|nr:cell wall hydrolase [Butyrivibrio sp.]
MKKSFQVMALCVVTSICIRFAAVNTPYTAYATSETKKALDDAKEERENLQNELDEKNEEVNDLKSEQSDLKSELSNLNTQLSDVSNNLAQIEADIDTKKAEIEETQAQLEAAMQTEADQYAAMKKRIQFIYESQDFVLIEILLEAESFADFLNNSEYIRLLSEYDREQLIAYQNTVASIEEAKALLEAEQAELESYQAAQIEEQNRVSGLVTSTSNAVSNYSDQIDAAEAEAEAKEAEIAAKDNDIAELQKKLEEEIRLSRLAAASSWRDISEVTFAEGDRFLLANLIYCEAGGEPYEGQLAVGAVVINRVLSSVYPDTVVGVIYQNKQFSPVASGRLELALAQDKATASCYRAADEAMSGVTNIGTCVYFRTPIPGLEGIQIGGHIFY